MSALIVLPLWLALASTTQDAATLNPILQTLVDRGVEAGGVAVALPRPNLADGLDAAASRAVLKEIAGDSRSVENFLRDSVSAPFVLKTRDVKAGESTIRVADLWFAVRGSLDDLDLKQVIGKTDAATVEAGNMKFTIKVLTDKDLSNRKLDRMPSGPGLDDWFTHASGRFLDRIQVDVTDHVVATRTADSLTVAASTAKRFDEDLAFPNRWATIARIGAREVVGAPQKYAGGGSYAKITRLAAEPGLLARRSSLRFRRT